MTETIPLPHGITLYRWTNPTGDEWACIASDHGPFCRLCQPVDGTLAACLENVMDGRFEIVSMDSQTGEFQFRVTPEGERQVERMIGDSNQDTSRDSD